MLLNPICYGQAGEKHPFFDRGWGFDYILPQASVLNTRIINCMSKAVGHLVCTFNGFMSVAQLLEDPRLARLYTFILREGEVTIDHTVDHRELPRSLASQSSYSRATRWRPSMSSPQISMRGMDRFCSRSGQIRGANGIAK